MNIDTSTYRSPNFSDRLETIKFIIIHRMALPFKESLEILCGAKYKVSSHFIIREDGQVFQLVPPEKSAWHAGVSEWHGITHLNEHSIGIELNNLEDAPYNTSQLDSCIGLCQQLMQEYKIPSENIIGHSDIAPDRKIDPGMYFDWSYLASRGIGKWYDTPSLPDQPNSLYKFGDSSAEILVLQDNLKKLGYKIDHTGRFDMQTNHVIRAFQAKYNPAVIKVLGPDFFKDEHSHYAWDETSQKTLVTLLSPKGNSKA